MAGAVRIRLVTGLSLPQLHLDDADHFYTLRSLRHILHLLLLVVPAIGLILLVTKPAGLADVDRRRDRRYRALYLLNLWWLCHS